MPSSPCIEWGAWMRRGLHILFAASAIASAGAARAEDVHYTYDALGRLTATSSNGPAGSSSLGYDPAGNRTTYSVVPGTAPPPSPATVVGGDFEAPDLPSGFLYNPSAGFTGNSGIARNGSAWGFDDAPGGDQVAFLQNGPSAATITLQIVNMTPGASYSARFLIMARPGYLGNPVAVAFNGAPIGTFNPTTYDFVAVTSAAFTPTASSGALTFTGLASADNMASAIDSVTVAP